MITFEGKSIYEYKLVIYAIFLILVKPAYFGEIAIINKLYLYVGFIAALFLIFLAFVDKHYSFERWWIILLWLVMGISTVYNHGDLYEFARSNYPMFAACLFFELWLKNNPKGLIHCSKILEIFVYINLLTVFLYPNGMYNNGMYDENWFLGYKNPQIRIILPIIAMNLMRNYGEKGKLSVSSLVLIVSAALTFYLVDSATSIVGMLMFIGLLFFFHSRTKKIPRIINLFLIYVASGLVFVGIFSFQLLQKFSWLIEGFLQRNLTLTTRTTIWTRVVQYIMQNPILGLGYKTGTEYGVMFLNKYATHPHNYFLYLLVYGGIILVALVTVGVLRASRKINKNISTIYSKIILFCVASFFVMGISESLVSTVLFYPMMIMAMNLDGISAIFKDVEINRKKLIKLKF